MSAVSLETMYHLKFLFLLCLSLFKDLNPQIDKPYFAKWVINKACYLKVEGSTNVSKFSCTIPDYIKPDTLTFYKGKGNEPLKVSGSIMPDVQGFDCHNQMMTKDLRKTLKAKDFPKLIIKFISLSKYPDLNKTEKVKGLVTIELAGITKRFDVDYQFISNSDNHITWIGKRQVLFSDFNIVPPRKIGGMIQTNNEIQVVFNLHVKVLD